MASVSTYLANKLNDLFFRGTSFSFPTTLYFALFTVAPTAGGGGTEVGGGSYARVGLTVDTSNFGASASGQTLNSVVITFPTPTADWGSIVAVAIFDAASSGNLLRFKTLATPVTINTGYVFSVPIGSMVASLI